VRPVRPDSTARTEDFAGGLFQPLNVRRFRLVCVEGPSLNRTWTSTGDRSSVGSHLSNDMVIADRTVSRFHCEILVDTKGARVRDLGSRNGTLVDGVQVFDAMLREASTLRVGRSLLRFELTEERESIPLSDRAEFGSLVGVSVPMRATFALLERASTSDATVLVEGETGTGKEGAAEAIHHGSVRRKGPFVVVDCSAIPSNLLESELFGHEKGAFTGATGTRTGAFESAEGGTLFLDEVGELPADLQPKLLRALGQRQIRRVGGSTLRSVDVRVIAATNRDLRAEVNAQRFRADLYFRLAVIKVHLPPLRRRPEDIPVLVKRILENLGADAQTAAPLLDPGFLWRLQRAAWPGNVRELRNHIERCLVLQDDIPIADVGAPDVMAPIDARVSYAESRRRALMDFERRYLRALLDLHGGNVSEAARSAGIARVYLHRLLRRHEVKGGG